MNAAPNGKHQAANVVVIGYCVHCRARRQMNGAIQVCNRRGGRDLKGLCSVCGKSMYRLGGWDTVVAAQEAAQNVSQAAFVQNSDQEEQEEQMEE